NLAVIRHCEGDLVAARFELARQGDNHIGQRTGASQRPALAADHEDFHREKLTADYADYTDEEARGAMTNLLFLIRAIRAIRGLNIPASPISALLRGHATHPPAAASRRPRGFLQTAARVSIPLRSG